MRKFLTALVLVPLGIIFLVFAVANRHSVTVSLDAFGSRDPNAGVTMPLFLVIIVVAILGVIAGGVTTWFRQRHWRRAARTFENDAIQARADLADLRARIATAPRSDPRLAIEGRNRESPGRSLPAPQNQAQGYGEPGRDKHGATL